MWLRWLVLALTLGTALGFGLGLSLFADLFARLDGRVPTSTLLPALAGGSEMRAEWLVLGCVAVVFALLALAGRRP